MSALEEIFRKPVYGHDATGERVLGDTLMPDVSDPVTVAEDEGSTDEDFTSPDGGAVQVPENLTGGSPGNEGMTLSSERAPVGGVMVNGVFYVGGQWIPGHVLDEMSEADKSALEQKIGRPIRRKPADTGASTNQGVASPGGGGEGRSPASGASPPPGDGSQTNKFSSTQFNISGELVGKILALGASIPDEALAADGREEEPHITILFGLQTSNAEDVARVVAGFGNVDVTLGETSLFEAKEASAQRGGDQFDVVKIDVTSNRLVELHELLKKSLSAEITHPQYQPHLTLAYVKPGEGKNHVCDNSLKGQRITFTTLTFSDQGDKKTIIPLSRQEGK